MNQEDERNLFLCGVKIEKAGLSCSADLCLPDRYTVIVTQILSAVMIIIFIIVNIGNYNVASHSCGGTGELQ